MNEMLAFPFVVFLIIFTALLSSIVTSALPYMPKYWYAFKMRIRRVFTPKPKVVVDMDKIALEQAWDKIKDLDAQVNTLAEKIATRDKHRAGNIRRVVREYLEELRTK